MPQSSDHVRLQVLVRREARDARGVAEVEAALRALGFEITGTGRASVSARATPDVFRAVFGNPPPLSSLRAAQRGRDLPVPPALAGCVESISVAPSHTPLGGARGDDRGEDT